MKGRGFKVKQITKNDIECAYRLEEIETLKSRAESTEFVDVVLLREVLKDRKYLFQKLGAWSDLKEAFVGVLE